MTSGSHGAAAFFEVITISNREMTTRQSVAGSRCRRLRRCEAEVRGAGHRKSRASDRKFCLLVHDFEASAVFI